MTTALSLIKSEIFEGNNADFYSDNETFFMTINQLASCLGYASTAGIGNLISRNEYLDSPEFSTTHKLCVVEGNRTVKRNIRLFSEDGIYEIAFLSKTAVAQMFRAWVRKILKELRQQSKQSQQLVPQKNVNYPLLDQLIYHLQQSQQFTVNTLMEQAYELGSVKDQLTIAKKEIKALKSQASRVERKLKNHIDNKPVITYFGDLQALYDDMSENYQSFVNCHTIQDAENNIVVECQSIFRVVELDKGRLIFRVTKYKPMKMCVLNVDKAERIDNWNGNKDVSKYRLFVKDGADPIEFEAVVKR